jgi:ketol-acid reductoisomerase
MTADGAAMRVFGHKDGDLRDLLGRSIAFVGYGNQGRAQALNLRDSLAAAGIDDVRIAVATQRDETWARAESDGFEVGPLASVLPGADVLFLLIPDEELAEVLRKEIAPHLRPNAAIVFASGYNLAFDDLDLPATIDVMLLAPRMIGRQLRELFEEGKGFYSYVSVAQDGSGNAWPLLLALANGVGTLAEGGGAFELSARDEAVLDLFHEQAFGSVFGAAMFTMLEVGLEAGLPAEALVLDYYLSGEIAESMRAMADLGFVEQSYLHSRTSQYGGMMRTLAIDREPLRKHLQTIMDEVRSGAFAKQWAAEREAACENFERLRALGKEHNPFTPIEERIRALVREAQERG